LATNKHRHNLPQCNWRPLCEDHCNSDKLATEELKNKEKCNFLPKNRKILDKEKKILDLLEKYQPKNVGEMKGLITEELGIKTESLGQTNHDGIIHIKKNKNPYVVEMMMKHEESHAEDVRALMDEHKVDDLSLWKKNYRNYRKGLHRAAKKDGFVKGEAKAYKKSIDYLEDQIKKLKKECRR